MWKGLAALTCVWVATAWPSPASAALVTVFSDAFDTDTSSLGETGIWQSHYCPDPWRTDLSQGASPVTDDGCGDVPYQPCPCNFGVHGACGEWDACSDPFDNHVTAGDENWTDYVLEADLHNNDNDTMGLSFRYTNTGNFYLLVFSRDVMPGLGHYDEKFVGSRLLNVYTDESNYVYATALMESTQVTYSQGWTHRIRVKLTGNHIQAFFDKNSDGIAADSELLFDVVDATHPKGKIGLFAFQNGADGMDCDNGAGCYFDNVVVSVEQPDVDGDGVPDVSDVCPMAYDPGQEDMDKDGLGDACDPDKNGNGIPDIEETLPDAVVRPPDAGSGKDAPWVPGIDAMAPPDAPWLPPGQDAVVQPDPGATALPDVSGDGSVFSVDGAGGSGAPVHFDAPGEASSGCAAGGTAGTPAALGLAVAAWAALSARRRALHR